MRKQRTERSEKKTIRCAACCPQTHGPGGSNEPPGLLMLQAVDAEPLKRSESRTCYMQPALQEPNITELRATAIDAPM